MFDHIVLRRSESGQPVSAGRIAEALLYYQKVHLFIDPLTLDTLIKQLGSKGVLSLLHMSGFSAVYCEEILGTKTEAVGVSMQHSFVAVTLWGRQDGVHLSSPEDRIRSDLVRGGMPPSEAKKFTQSFLRLVPVRRLAGDHFVKGGVVKAAAEDLRDIDYIKKAFKAALAVTPGGYDLGDYFKFEIIDVEQGVFVFSDIDFDRINSQRRNLASPMEPLTMAHLLTNMLEARADLALASFYGGDFVTSDVPSTILQVRHEELLRRTNLNGKDQRQFAEVMLPDCRSLAEVIDSGERSFEEFVALLNRSDRFKDWLKGVNPDEGLVQTYIRDINSDAWISSLPGKTLRYVITQGLEKANPIVGVAAGIIDNFFIEKLCSGWRPNHFVSAKLEPFVRGY